MNRIFIQPEEEHLLKNHKSILDYLEHTAALYPDAPAYCSENEQITWGEVRQSARQIGACLLHTRTAHPFVAIFMEKAPHTVAAMLGSVYAGGCYTVLNTALWETNGTKLAELLSFLEPDVLLYDTAFAKQAEQLLQENASLLQTVFPLYLDTSRTDSAFTISGISDDCLASAEHTLLTLRATASPEDTLCLTFTSSSSGKPKCVETSHLAVIRYIDALSDILQATEATVFGNQAPFCFDACMKELFVSMKCGGSVWLLPPELFSRPEELIQYLNQHQINTICWVSSAYSLIAATDAFAEIRPESLRTAAFGSEVLPPSVLAYWQTALPDVCFFNLYGPTEATGMSCYYPVPKNFTNRLPSTDPIPIGKPFFGVEAYLLDEDGKPVADGEQGELYLKSNRLAKGYYRQEDLTRQVFFPLAASSYQIYRTGDLAKRLPSGDLVFLGRKDSQVKRMGYRIDLAELERLAAACPQVKSCCCVQKADGRIVLYILGKNVGASSSLSARVSALLRQSLPSYALPNRIILRDSLPSLPNGKIDRRRLREE